MIDAWELQAEKFDGGPSRRTRPAKALKRRWRDSMVLTSRLSSGGYNAIVEAGALNHCLAGTILPRWTTDRCGGSMRSFKEPRMLRSCSCAKRWTSTAARLRSTTRLRAWDTGIKKTLRASEQERADVQRCRKAWIASQRHLDLRQVVFVDESGAKTNMTRLRGRARRGARVMDSAPHGHWCTTTMIGSIRLDGTSACMTVDGATDKDVFREYVRRVLVPTLRPGDIVVLDNLGAHKDAEAETLIEGVHAELRFLPPYSPDLNPIEKMWSKIKEFLRGAKARTEEELYEAIGTALATVTQQDAEGWFQSCGYTASQH